MNKPVRKANKITKAMERTRQTVSVNVKPTRYIHMDVFSGNTLKECVDYLTSLQQEYPDRDIVLDYDNEYEFILKERRKETDEELINRHNRYLISKQQSDDHDRKLYERLKVKFEGK